MTFNEQACIEIIKGCFVVLGLIIGGGVLTRAVERFKGETATLGDLRRMQYEALGRLMAALGQHETAFDTLSAALENALPKVEIDQLQARCARARVSTLEVVNSTEYLVGLTVAHDAISLASFINDNAHKPNRVHAYFDERNRLIKPLVDLMPALPVLGRSAR